MDINQLKYPIGEFRAPYRITPATRENYINDLERLPGQMTEAVEGLSDEQLDTAYRPEGWTIRQVVHHVTDSHLNGYIRYKWALTEPDPLIKAYNEQAWAILPDSLEGPVEMSLHLLTSLHTRWVWLLKSISDEDWSKSFNHPETGNQVQLDLDLSLYSWHGKHHLAHITSLVERKGWK